MAARRQALRLAARALEQRLNADTSDYAGPQLACACGRSARYVDRRAKSLVSVLGPLRLERAYYHCAACGRGFCPRDRELGLQDSSLSPAVTRMTAAVGALVSFQEGSALLKELAGVEVEAKQVDEQAKSWVRRSLKMSRVEWKPRVASPCLPRSTWGSMGPVCRCAVLS
jgi:hypothetical protein